MQSARLNIFQRLTRQWDSLHPYNAAQAMQLAGKPNLEKIKSTWEETIAANEFQSEEIIVEKSLDDLMTRELNRPFENDKAFRPFVIENDSSYFLGVVYHHWIADSFSIRLLLREWFDRLFNNASNRLRFRGATAGYWKLFGPAQSTWSLGGAALDLFRWSAKLRRARRIDPHHMQDLRTHFSLHHAPDGLIDSISKRARERDVTVNDVFLAAMAQACLATVPVRRTPRRLDLALGTITDLRPRARISLNDTFGLFLGFTSIFCRPDDLSDWNRLLARIHQQNVLQKDTAAAESSMVRMSAGLLIGKILSRDRLLEFYRKRIALAGGISNVNLNRDWPARFHPSPILDYVRVSPSGPMMPVVFTPTTLGSRLNVGLTCRASVDSPQRANEMIAIFFDQLQRFADQ